MNFKKRSLISIKIPYKSLSIIWNLLTRPKGLIYLKLKRIISQNENLSSKKNIYVYIHATV